MINQLLNIKFCSCKIIGDANGEWHYARWNQLIWSENGFTFVLQSNVPADMLSLEEMLKIAESIIQ
jgi:hypothetical protein